MTTRRPLLVSLREAHRLMRRTEITLADALDLLVDQLRQFDEQRQLDEAMEHADYPRHLYGL